MKKLMTAALCVLTLSTGCALAAEAGRTSSEPLEQHTVEAPFAAAQAAIDKTAGKPGTAIETAAEEAAVKPQDGQKPVVTITSGPAVQVQKTTPPTPAKTQPVKQEKKIMINLASRILTLYQGNTPINMYPVGVGKVETPTPVGYFSVSEKIVNPTWIDPDSGTSISSGPDCPLGYRWLGLFGNYGIHGTNKPYSIGGYVSNGCIRMYEEDVEDLYDHVPVGTAVDIYYDRIVIGRDADHTISYYIYPDGYGWQRLDVAAVKKALAGYGVADFAEADDIYDKIIASDGSPTYVAKAYDLYVNDKKLPKRALGKDGKVWMPAFALATATHTETEWSGANQVLTTANGTSGGIVRSDVVYINDANAKRLYGLKGSLGKDYVYRLTKVAPLVKPAAKATTAAPAKPAPVAPKKAKK